MKGIPSNLCTHHIYIKIDSRPVCQLQRRMNPNLRDIVKEEIQNLLEASFKYLISDNEWVYPLVIVPNKKQENITKENLVSDTSIIPVLNQNEKSILVEIDPGKVTEYQSEPRS